MNTFSHTEKYTSKIGEKFVDSGDSQKTYIHECEPVHARMILCVYICVYIYIYTYIHTCIHIIYIYVYIYTYVCIRRNIIEKFVESDEGPRLLNQRADGDFFKVCSCVSMCACTCILAHVCPCPTQTPDGDFFKACLHVSMCACACMSLFDVYLRTFFPVGRNLLSQYAIATASRYVCVCVCVCACACVRACVRACVCGPALDLRAFFTSCVCLTPSATAAASARFFRHIYP